MRSLTLLSVLVIALSFTGCSNKQKPTKKVQHKEMRYYILIDKTNDMDSVVPLKYLLDDIDVTVRVDQSSNNYTLYTEAMHCLKDANYVLHYLHVNGYKYAKIIKY